MTYNLLLVKVARRSQAASEVQKILTEFGCSIRTRLGLHEVSPAYCAEDGLIILELQGKPENIKTLEERLSRVPGVTALAVEI